MRLASFITWYFSCRHFPTLNLSSVQQAALRSSLPTPAPFQSLMVPLDPASNLPSPLHLRPDPTLRSIPNGFGTARNSVLTSTSDSLKRRSSSHLTRHLPSQLVPPTSLPSRSRSCSASGARSGAQVPLRGPTRSSQLPQRERFSSELWHGWRWPLRSVWARSA